MSWPSIKWWSLTSRWSGYPLDANSRIGQVLMRNEIGSRRLNTAIVLWKLITQRIVILWNVDALAYIQEQGSREMSRWVSTNCRHSELASGVKYHRSSTTRESSMRGMVWPTLEWISLRTQFSKGSGAQTSNYTLQASSRTAPCASSSCLKLSCQGELPPIWCMRKIHWTGSKPTWLKYLIR